MRATLPPTRVPANCRAMSNAAVTASARMCLDPTDVSAMMDTQVTSAGFTSFGSGSGQPVARVLDGNPEHVEPA